MLILQDLQDLQDLQSWFTILIYNLDLQVLYETYKSYALLHRSTLECFADLAIISPKCWPEIINKNSFELLVYFVVYFVRFLPTSGQLLSDVIALWQFLGSVWQISCSYQVYRNLEKRGQHVAESCQFTYRKDKHTFENNYVNSLALLTSRQG